MTRSLRLATRGSPLAMWQTARVGELLGVPWEPVVMTTRGDARRDIPAEDIPGGPGVFTKEVQDAVLDGRADAAVHSAKDLPTARTPGLIIASTPERADPRDALIGDALADLPLHATVATDSPRRRAQLQWRRPDLRFALLRGNVGTRLAKLDAGEADAIVLAMAGLERLGVDRADVFPMSPDEMLPAMGQGTLAVECREDDRATIEVLRAASNADVMAGLEAERAAIARLGGGCEAAAGALVSGGVLTVLAVRADGEPVSASGPASAPLEVADEVLSKWRAAS